MCGKTKAEQNLRQLPADLQYTLIGNRIEHFRKSIGNLARVHIASTRNWSKLDPARASMGDADSLSAGTYWHNPSSNRYVYVARGLRSTSCASVIEFELCGLAERPCLVHGISDGVRLCWRMVTPLNQKKIDLGLGFSPAVPLFFRPSAADDQKLAERTKKTHRSCGHGSGAISPRSRVCWHMVCVLCTLTLR